MVDIEEDSVLYKKRGLLMSKLAASVFMID